MKQHSIYKHIAAAVVVMASCFALSSVPVSAESNVAGMDLSFANHSNAPEKWMPWYIYVKPGEKAVARFTVTKEGNDSFGNFVMIGPGDALIDQKGIKATSAVLPGGDTTTGKISEVILESPVATKAGVYWVRAEGSANTAKGQDFRMGWTIGATKTTVDKIIPGRVWADSYKVTNQNRLHPTPGHLANLPLFYVSEEGFQYKAEYRGYMGIHSVFRTNKYGVVYKGTCVSAYQSLGDGRSKDKNIDLLHQDSSKCGGQYKVFFAKPANDLPQSVKLPNGQTTWLNNPIVKTEVKNMKFISANDVKVPLKGDIIANVKNYTGNLDLLVDADGNGKYTDLVDRKIPFSATTESAKYSFDGKDSQGNIIPRGVKVNFRIDAQKKGEIHFVRSDAEISKGGMTLQRLNGSPNKRTMLHWNDSNLNKNYKCGNQYINPMNNLKGVDSSAGVHGWDAERCVYPASEGGVASNGNTKPGWTGEDYKNASSWGDNRFIDDWAFDEDSANASVSYEAPPLKKIQVCNLESKKVATIDEPEFSISMHSEDLADCEPIINVPNTGAAQLVANGTKALPWLLGAGAIAYYLRRRS